MALTVSHPSLSSSPFSLEMPPTPGGETAVMVSAASGPSAFEQTTQNLLKLGSLTMDKFTQDPSEELDGFDIPVVNLSSSNALGSATARNLENGDEEFDDVPIVPPNEAIQFLQDTAQKVFGATPFDPLQYEILEEQGQDRKCCILTITRPNSISRSYRTNPEFSRTSDAKVAAATSAIQMGAVNFIKHGELTALGKRRLVLAKLDAGAKNNGGDASDSSKTANVGGAEHTGGEDGADSAALEIERCCLEWRGGEVVPQWVYLVEQKFSSAYGCALKIALSPHLQRTYSVLVSSEYPRKYLAKAACAKLALEQDVINFIKHGDGRLQPLMVPFMGAEALPPPPPPRATTLQTFYAALPKPMPDHIGTKNNGEFNAVAWLNNMVQVAKGSRMTTAYYWHTNTKLGLHGCLLRLTRPDAPSQSYLVDAIFAKRADAKVAVCLFACSQGLGSYVRKVAAEIEARVSTEMRRRCTEEILPALVQALHKVRQGLRPDFTYDCDLSSFGCTLTVDLSSDSDSPPVKKQWKVPIAYKSKTDAKVAVVCEAADDGLLEFIGFRGKESPAAGESGEIIGEAVGTEELEEGETTVESEKRRSKRKWREDNDTSEDGRLRGSLDAAKRPQRGFGGRGRGVGFTRPLSRGGFGPVGFRGGFIPGRYGGTGGFHPSYPNHFYPQFRPSMSFSSLGAPVPLHYPYSFLPPGFANNTYFAEYGYRNQSFLVGDSWPAHRQHAHGMPPVMPAYQYHGQERDYDYDYAHERHGYRAQPHYSDSSVHSGRRQEWNKGEMDGVPSGPRADMIAKSRVKQDTSVELPSRASVSDQSTTVPEKRGRSSEREGSESRKRARTSSRSKSRDGDESIASSSHVQSEEQELGSENSMLRNPDLNGNVTGSKDASVVSSATQARPHENESYVIALLDQCVKEGLPRPKFCHEEIISDSEETNKMYKVWIVMGSETLEVPISFSTLLAGQEWVAKTLLCKLRVRTRLRKDIVKDI